MNPLNLEASMSVFALHARALSTYKDFVRSFVKIADPRLRQFVEEAILGDAGGLWPEPLVQLSPAYEQGATVDELAEEGLLHPTTARVFRRADGSPFRLYRHQVEALRRAREGKSYVLTSGTGSGKSFAYFIPVLDLVARNPGLKGPVALVVYPMNALVNSQLHALEELKERYETRYGEPFPLRFARYTGQTLEDERRAIRENPPHLLLTNYVMGEYLLTRPEDRPLVSPPPSHLPFFLVFDELHTYRGRQGADVALLARRLRARVGDRPVVHVGTSATLIAREGATPEERREAVARFASIFFGRDIPPEDVVEERLTPATRGGPPSDEDLRAGVRTPVPRDLEAFRAHPLARFAEYALGLKEEGGGYARRKPRPLSEVAAGLAARTGLSIEEARGRIEEVLEVGAGLQEAGRPLFAFKLHQFVSQTSAVRASLEEAEDREVVTRALGRILRDVREKGWHILVFTVFDGWVYYEGYTPAPGERFLVPSGDTPWEVLSTLEARGVRFRRQGRRVVVAPAELAKDTFRAVEHLLPLVLSVLEDGEEVGAGEVLRRLQGALSAPRAQA